MRRRSTWIVLASLVLLAACDTEKVELLKSPCAGIDGNPCGPKRPVNGILNTAVPPERA